MLFVSCVIAVAVSVALSSLILLKSRFEKPCSGNYQGRAEILRAAKIMEAVVSELDGNTRASSRAVALCLASISLRGEFNMANLLGLADEYLKYIEGENASPIPLHDKLAKGRMPKP